MSAKILRYWDFAEQRDAPLTCPQCGWTGPAGNHIEQYDELFDVCCPECRTMILIVMFPTLVETREAAAAGNEHAAKDLPEMEAHEELMRRRYETLLRSLDQLPALADEQVSIVWDFEEDGNGENWTILRAGAEQIWREFAFWEGIGRFEEVVKILREKYGPRLVEVRPTKRSEVYLWGDKWDADTTVEKINDSLRDNRAETV